MLVRQEQRVRPAQRDQQEQQVQPGLKVLWVLLVQQEPPC
jgi:hypothetical protein